MIKKNKTLQILVQNEQQLASIWKSGIEPDRIYLDYHMLLPAGRTLRAMLEAHPACEYYAALPYMMREEKMIPGLSDIREIWDTCKDFLRGFLVRNLEELGYLRLADQFGNGTYDGAIVSDYGVYTWNHGAADLFMNECGVSECAIPYELNLHEVRDFLKQMQETAPGAAQTFAMCIYGRIPMMISAGCLKKTGGSCSGKMGQNETGLLSVVDRKNNRMPVVTDCRTCLNIIYNAVPLSLHKQMRDLLSEDRIGTLRIDLTCENEIECLDVLRFWKNILSGSREEAPYKDYTTGHYKRGVE